MERDEGGSSEHTRNKTAVIKWGGKGLSGYAGLKQLAAWTFDKQMQLNPRPK